MRTVHIILDRTPKGKRPLGLVPKLNFEAYVRGTGFNWLKIGFTNGF
jgi:hypothetical protein